MDALLKALPPALVPVATALVATLRKEARGLREDVKWGNPVYLRDREILLGLMVYPRYVHLALWRGAELADRFPEVEGTGRKLRHVRVADAKDARSPKVIRVIRASLALPPTGPAKPRA